MINHKFFPVVLLSLLLIGISACSDEDITNPIGNDPKRGDLVSYNSQIILSPFLIETTIEQYTGGELDFDPIYTVEVVTVTYKTVDTEGNIVDASGALVIPISDKTFPLMSIHHGTQTKRDKVGSESFLNSIEAVISGSLGYVTCTPDYLGLGISNQFHPYHHEETSAATAIDFLLAAREYCEQESISLNDQLFLAGYSQGGYVTLAVQKEIEANYSDEFTVTASAPMAGAHDLYETALYIVSEPTYDRPSFLAYLVFAYNNIYNWNNLDYIFNEPYDQLILTLFDGSLPTWEIDDQLPTSIPELFTEDFISDINSNRSPEITNRLKENSLLDWIPVAPITIVHGNEDTYVPYFNAVKAQQQLKANGAAYVDLVTIEGGTHGSSVYPAMAFAIKWFDAFRSPVSLAGNPN